jgi:5-methylcytosine-specific restriction endonuclease McrA
MKTVEHRNIETDLRDAAAARGATVTDKGNGHYQIKGRLLVNYYPLSKKRTAYVAQTTHGKHYTSPTEAVEMAFTPPPIAPEHKKDERHGHPKAQRKRLIRKNGARCHWCGCAVTLATSTVEHVIPLHRGGLDNANNRVLACKPCNQSRGHDMPELKALT